MRGIAVTTDELAAFAKRIGKQYIDEYIPLPNVGEKIQIRMATGKEQCPDNCDDATNNGSTNEYWETETGDHGWCCGTCGKVHQWG